MSDPRIIDIEIEDKIVDTDALHAELKAELGDLCTGLSYVPDTGRVIVHLVEGASLQQRNKAKTIVAVHDVAKLPPKVKPKSAEERIAELEATVAQLLAERVTPLRVGNR